MLLERPWWNVFCPLKLLKQPLCQQRLSVLTRVYADMCACVVVVPLSCTPLGPLRPRELRY